MILSAVWYIKILTYCSCGSNYLISAPWIFSCHLTLSRSYDNNTSQTRNHQISFYHFLGSFSCTAILIDTPFLTDTSIDIYEHVGTILNKFLSFYTQIEVRTILDSSQMWSFHILSFLVALYIYFNILILVTLTFICIVSKLPNIMIMNLFTLFMDLIILQWFSIYVNNYSSSLKLHVWQL